MSKRRFNKSFPNKLFAEFRSILPLTKNKLINLPKFLGGSIDRNQNNELKDLIQGLQLTKFFLELNFFKDKPFPNSRLRFKKLLEDKL